MAQAKKKKITPKEKKRIVRDRTILEWALLIILLLLAYFFLAQSYKLWPFDTLTDDLGSAFYTTPGALKGVNKSDLTPTGSYNGNGSASDTSGTSGTSGSTGASGNTGGNSGNNGGSNTGGNSGGTTPASNGSASLLSFAAGVNTGMTKEQLNVAANGLNQGCTIVADTANFGKQEVCVYTQGNRAVTVTLMNDRVVSASLSNR